MLPEIDKIGMAATLEAGEEVCMLKHGPLTYRGESRDDEPHKAVDWLMIPMGHKEGEVEVIDNFLSIPICQDCVDGLNNGEWYLLYCAECGDSQWIIKELARRHYPQTVNVLRECPSCKFKNLPGFNS